MTKPVTRAHLRKGPAPKLPPADAVARVAALAAVGLPVRGVAASLGTSADTLRRWMSEDPELAEAFEVGRELERQALHAALYKAATKNGDKIAAMFLLKARHGYREGEKTDAAQQPTVVINLPGATPLANFRVIDHE
ncbi:hypothetical protein [Phenylobacterium sp.]|uniref:hypothetical protein n=1 Tax=Phenylobacterium sp. TaxID=1871053 RepID=UPI00374D7061